MRTVFFPPLSEGVLLTGHWELVYITNDWEGFWTRRIRKASWVPLYFVYPSEKKKSDRKADKIKEYVHLETRLSTDM